MCASRLLKLVLCALVLTTTCGAFSTESDVPSERLQPEVDPLVGDELEFTTVDSLAEAEGMLADGSSYRITSSSSISRTRVEFEAMIQTRNSECKDLETKEYCSDKSKSKCHDKAPQPQLKCKKTCGQCSDTFYLETFSGSGTCGGGKGKASRSKKIKVGEWTLLSRYGFNPKSRVSANVYGNPEWWIYYIYLMVGTKQQCGHYLAKNKIGQDGLAKMDATLGNQIKKANTEFKGGENCILLDKRVKKFNCIFVGKEVQQGNTKSCGKHTGPDCQFYRGAKFLKNMRCDPYEGYPDKSKEPAESFSKGKTSLFQYLRDVEAKRGGSWLWSDGCLKHGLYNRTLGLGQRWPQCVDYLATGTIPRVSPVPSFKNLLGPVSQITPPAAHHDTKSGPDWDSYPMIVGKPGDCFSKCVDVPFFSLGKERHFEGWAAVTKSGRIQRQKKWTCTEANRLGCNMDFGKVIFRPTGEHLKCCNTDKSGVKRNEWGVKNPYYAPNSRSVRLLKELLADAKLKETEAVEKETSSTAKLNKQRRRKRKKHWKKKNEKNEKEVTKATEKVKKYQEKLEERLQQNKKYECDLPKEGEGASYRL